MPDDSKTDGSDPDQIYTIDHNTSRIAEVREDPDLCRKMSKADDSNGEESDAKHDSNSSSSEDDNTTIDVRDDSPDSIDQQITPMLNELSIASDNSLQNVESKIFLSGTRKLQTRTISESSDDDASSTSEEESDDQNEWSEEARRKRREEVVKFFSRGIENTDDISDKDDNNGDDEDDDPTETRPRGRVRCTKQTDHHQKPYNHSNFEESQRFQRTVDVPGVQTLGNNYRDNLIQHRQNEEFLHENYHDENFTIINDDVESLTIENNIPADPEALEAFLRNLNDNTPSPDILNQNEQKILQSSNYPGQITSASLMHASGSPIESIETHNILSDSYDVHSMHRILINGSPVPSPEPQTVPTNGCYINRCSPSHYMFPGGSQIPSPKTQNEESWQFNSQYSPQAPKFGERSLSPAFGTLSAQPSIYATGTSPQSSMYGDSSPGLSPQAQIVPSTVFYNNCSTSFTSFINESSPQLLEVIGSHTIPQSLFQESSTQLSDISESISSPYPTATSNWQDNIGFAEGNSSLLINTPPQSISDSPKQEFDTSYFDDYQLYSYGTDNQTFVMQGMNQTNNATNFLKLSSNTLTSDNNNFNIHNNSDVQSGIQDEHTRFQILPNSTAPTSVYDNICQTSNTTQLHSPTTPLQLSREVTKPQNLQPAPITIRHDSFGGTVIVNRNDEVEQNVSKSFDDHITTQKEPRRNKTKSKKPLKHAASNAASTKKDNTLVPVSVEIFEKKPSKTNVIATFEEIWNSLNLPAVEASKKLKTKVTKNDTLEAQIRLFKKSNEYFEMKDESGNTFLMTIVRDSSVFWKYRRYLGPVLSKMEDSPHSLITKNNNGHDALYLAANNCPNHDYVSGVLAAKIFTLHGSNSEFWKRTYDNGNTLIHELAAKGDTHLPVLRELFAVQRSMKHNIFDLSAKNNEGWTPLQVAAAAARNGRITTKTVALLREYDVDRINPEYRNVDTLLRTAMSYARGTGVVI